MKIFQDWKNNKSNIKGKLVLVLFRVCSIGSRGKLQFVFLLPFLILYRLLIEWTLGIEIPYKTIIGSGCKLYHGQALVINDGTVIGKNCTLRHSTTIGNKQLSDGKFSSCPIIGDEVDIGSNVCIIGPIKIGNNVKIGAGTVVVKDIPDGAIVVGNPARIMNP